MINVNILVNSHHFINIAWIKLIFIRFHTLNSECEKFCPDGTKVAGMEI
jgi:hypothetical protein